MRKVYTTLQDNSGSDRVAIINQGPIPRSSSLVSDAGSFGLSKQKSKETKVRELFEKHKLLIEAMYKYPWLSGSINHIARTIVGPGYSITVSDLSKDIDEKLISTKEASVERFLKNKFIRRNSNFNNVKDLITFSNKLYQTVIYYVLFGFAAWETIFDERGAASGFDHIFEMVVPNFGKNGNFKTPAFVGFSYGKDGPKDPTNYKRPEDVVFFVSPSITGEIAGRSFIETLTDYVIPADLYAAYSYLNLHKNFTKPSGIWTVPDVEKEEFDRFTHQLRERYEGSDNYGRAAIAVRGSVDFKEFRTPAKDDMPYVEGRKYSRNEVAAMTGVPTFKLGVAEDMDKSDIQSMQREYFENTLRPITRSLEETINAQVINRYFNTEDIKFKFNQPDFMKAVERSTVARRFFEIGALSPNEIRRDYLRKPPREGGDLFVEELKIASNTFMSGDNPLKGGPRKEAGGPPEDRVPGSEDQEREPGDVGVPNSQKPTRAERQRVFIARADFQKMMDEVDNWRKIHVEMVLGQRPFREFEFKHIPKHMAEAIQKEAALLIYNEKNDLLYRLQNVYRLSGIITEVITSFFDVVESVAKEES